MSEFTVTRTMKAPRERVWQALTQPSDFEAWLPAKSGTAVLDVRTGGSWQATVISAEGEEIDLSEAAGRASAPAGDVGSTSELALAADLIETVLLVGPDAPAATA